MHGPVIMARSMSALRIPDKFGNAWQYHSRSDAHSKIACWAIMFDLLLNSTLLRDHARVGKVGFGLNHEMRDFQTRRKKDLDLVICTPGSPGAAKKPRKKSGVPIETFADLAGGFSVLLSSSEKKALQELLHDELDSSHLTIHGHADHAIAAALVTINLASEFTSPGRNKADLALNARDVTPLDQPKATERTISKVHELRRRSSAGQAGFDAIGIVIFNFPNDGSPCTLVSTPPAPSSDDPFHYDQMISRIAGLYHAKFTGL
jgi:hypothetical protein